MLDAHGHEYPSQKVRVISVPADFASLFPKPIGLVDDVWPPTQITYLGAYIAQLECKTIIIESHYIDRDYMLDLAFFYARSLRNLPNYCQRLHFFKKEFDHNTWRKLITDANHGQIEDAQRFLQQGYLGFSVVRPLPGSPVGRTVLITFPDRTAEGKLRHYGAVRDYRVHIAGFKLQVEGLAFQQQDQGVSACATAALWSAIHRVAHMEGLPAPTPAEITEAASRYFLPEGRPLPSAGLTIHQVCEAVRAAGLAPLVISGGPFDKDRAELMGYISSGFAPLLAIGDPTGANKDGHAICGVGLKLDQVQPQTDPKLNYRDASTAVCGIYIHDDRLGPYASADIFPATILNDPIIRTGLQIRWPGKPDMYDHAYLKALVVPVPIKVRLTISQIRALGLAIADATGQFWPKFDRAVVLKCQYQLATCYQKRAFGFELSDDGIHKLNCETALSRYIGIIEISLANAPLFDVILDTTETRANLAVLACVRRHALPIELNSFLESVAYRLGGIFIA